MRLIHPSIRAGAISLDTRIPCWQGIWQRILSILLSTRQWPAPIYDVIPGQYVQTRRFPQRSAQGIFSAGAGNFSRAGREFVRRAGNSCVAIRYPASGEGAGLLVKPAMTLDQPGAIA
jgi:hypothetical protein